MVLSSAGCNRRPTARQYSQAARMVAEGTAVSIAAADVGLSERSLYRHLARRGIRRADPLLDRVLELRAAGVPWRTIHRTEPGVAERWADPSALRHLVYRVARAGQTG